MVSFWSNLFKRFFHKSDGGSLCEQPIEKMSEPLNFHTTYENYQSRTGNVLTETIANKGSLGEMQTFSSLGRHFGCNRVFANIYLPSKNGETSEVDLILLTPCEIYIIENKNFSGAVYGKESSKKWTQYIAGQPYTFYNPILQNKGHCNAFQNMFPTIQPDKIYPIVVFNNLCKMKITVNSTVIPRGKLVDCIKDRQAGLKPCFTEQYLSKISDTLLAHSLQDKKIVQQHIQYVNLKKQ